MERIHWDFFLDRKKRKIRYGILQKVQLLMLTCYSSGYKSSGHSATIVLNGENFQSMFFFPPGGRVLIIPRRKAGEL